MIAIFALRVRHFSLSLSFLDEELNFQFNHFQLSLTTLNNADIDLRQLRAYVDPFHIAGPSPLLH